MESLLKRKFEIKQNYSSGLKLNGINLAFTTMFLEIVIFFINIIKYISSFLSPSWSILWGVRYIFLVVTLCHSHIGTEQHAIRNIKKGRSGWSLLALNKPFVSVSPRWWLQVFISVCTIFNPVKDLRR